MPGLSADDVLNAKFSPTKFREGYDQDEVDDFLDRVVALLGRQDPDSPETRAAVAELCRGARFAVTKFREGYDQQQVDDLLDTLAGGDGGAAPRTAASPGSTTSPTASTRSARPSTSTMPPGMADAGRPSRVATVVVAALVVAAVVVAAVWLLS